MTYDEGIPMSDTIDDMASILIDEEADLDNRAECMTILSNSGFSTSAINVFLDDAIEEARDQECTVVF